MAHRLDSYDFPPGGRSGKYPWDEWFDGHVWRLIGGEDFQTPVRNFRRQAISAAQRRGLKAQTAVKDGDVILRAFPLDPEGP